MAGKYSSGHGYNPGLAKPLHFSSLSLVFAECLLRGRSPKHVYLRNFVSP